MGKPEIRFKGFTDDWEQRKLGEMGSTFTGLSGKTKEDFGHGDAKFITYMNVFSNPIADLQMTETVEIDSKQNCVKAGDVFFTTSSETPEEVGMSCVMPENADNTYLNSFCFGYRPTEKFDLNYLAYVLRSESFRKEMTFLAQGISRYNISKNKVMEVEIPVPSLEEQSKVGRYFSNLDNLITLHQRKCDEVKTLKKYMLQKMFPQNGINVPEIRFSGFTDVWEQRKLGEVIEDYVEKTTVENQYPVLTSSQQMGIVLQDDYFSGDRVSQSGNIGYFVIPRGYFAYRSRSDNDVFVFNRNDCIDKGSISYFYPVFKPSGVDSDFLLRRLNYGLETQLKIASEGTGQHVLSLKKFKNMTALFPSINEQRKIGEYFTRLDHLITLHQRKCNELRKMKKFMLQNMFPKD